MTSVVDLLDLWPSEDVAAGLHETPEVIRRWREAGAVPEARARDLFEFAFLHGPLDDVARIAADAAPFYADLAAMLHDLGKSSDSFQRPIRSGQEFAPSRGGARKDTGRSITQILEDVREHRGPGGDAVERVRTSRAEWDGRDDLNDRIRTGGRH